MERTGKIPTCILGIEYHINSSEVSNTAVVNKVKEEENEVIPHLDVPRNFKSDMSELNTNLVWFQALMLKGMTKQWNGMGVFYKQTKEKFPEKLYRLICLTIYDFFRVDYLYLNHLH